ncbi:uncharacterized protein ARMOST_21887 [Armillaria ostoyae]|uniref:Uncharacterized protein n=1 Tax=Armillaria ostoyae TaxID=47428 RepID=A0A284SBB2_ARMOS|nr:uncharacterized protein ARMOST_21887 [Armillaria ostoyae]
MTTSDRSLRFEPSSLDLTVSAGLNLNQLTKSLLEVYANVLAVAIEEQCPPSQIEDLKMKMLQVATKNELTVFSSKLNLPTVDPETERVNLISEAMWFIFKHDHSVPVHTAEWANHILALASHMTPMEIAEFKSQCNPVVWAALVFSNIRKTSTHVLMDLTIGKVKIVDWDLFPSPCITKCSNCKQKCHECQLQALGIQKCRECALFQLSCPKPKHILNTAPSLQEVDHPLDKKWKRMDETVMMWQLDMLKNDIEALRITIELNTATYKKLKSAFE